MSKYDVEKFDPAPDPDLICCICHCVLDRAVESPCQHVFCQVCIETWLTNRHTCPTCRKRTRKQDLKPVLPLVQNMLNRLLMICDYRDNGCLEKVMLEHYKNHVSNCGYEKKVCRFLKCGLTILKMDVERHESQECEHREKLCDGQCGLMVALSDLDTHDCVQSLKQHIEEKNTLIDTLKTKLQELNNLSQSLNVQLEQLRVQLDERRPRFYPSSFTSSDTDVTEFSLDDFSQSDTSDDEVTDFPDDTNNNDNNHENNNNDGNTREPVNEVVNQMERSVVSSLFDLSSRLDRVRNAMRSVLNSRTNEENQNQNSDLLISLPIMNTPINSNIGGAYVQATSIRIPGRQTATVSTQLQPERIVVPRNSIPTTSTITAPSAASNHNVQSTYELQDSILPPQSMDFSGETIPRPSQATTELADHTDRHTPPWSSPRLSSPRYLLTDDPEEDHPSQENTAQDLYSYTDDRSDYSGVSSPLHTPPCEPTVSPSCSQSSTDQTAVVQVGSSPSASSVSSLSASPQTPYCSPSLDSRHSNHSCATLTSRDSVPAGSPLSDSSGLYRCSDRNTSENRTSSDRASPVSARRSDSSDEDGSFHSYDSDRSRSDRTSMSSTPHSRQSGNTSRYWSTGSTADSQVSPASSRSASHSSHLDQSQSDNNDTSTVSESYRSPSLPASPASSGYHYTSDSSDHEYTKKTDRSNSDHENSRKRDYSNSDSDHSRSGFDSVNESSSKGDYSDSEHGPSRTKGSSNSEQDNTGSDSEADHNSGCGSNRNTTSNASNDSETDESKRVIVCSSDISLHQKSPINSDDDRDSSSAVTSPETSKDSDSSEDSSSSIQYITKRKRRVVPRQVRSVIQEAGSSSENGDSGRKLRSFNSSGECATVVSVRSTECSKPSFSAINTTSNKGRKRQHAATALTDERDSLCTAKRERQEHPDPRVVSPTGQPQNVTSTSQSVNVKIDLSLINFSSGIGSSSVTSSAGLVPGGAGYGTQSGSGETVSLQADSIDRNIGRSPKSASATRSCNVLQPSERKYVTRSVTRNVRNQTGRVMTRSVRAPCNREFPHNWRDDSNSEDSDRDCEPEALVLDSDPWLIDSDVDSDSSYEVLVPKTASDLLEEYASDETDESWVPDVD